MPIKNFWCSNRNLGTSLCGTDDNKIHIFISVARYISTLPENKNTQKFCFFMTTFRKSVLSLVDDHVAPGLPKLLIREATTSRATSLNFTC